MVSNLILFFMQINKVRWILYRWKGGWLVFLHVGNANWWYRTYVYGFCVMLWHTFCWIPLKKSEGLYLKWISSRHDNEVSPSLNYNCFCLLNFFDWMTILSSYQVCIKTNKTCIVDLWITKLILESNTTDIDLMSCPFLMLFSF